MCVDNKKRERLGDDKEEERGGVDWNGIEKKFNREIYIASFAKNSSNSIQFCVSDPNEKKEQKKGCAWLARLLLTVYAIFLKYCAAHPQCNRNGISRFGADGFNPNGVCINQSPGKWLPIDQIEDDMFGRPPAAAAVTYISIQYLYV